MRGSRWLAVLIALAIGVTGISAGTAVSAPAGKDPGKKHQQHKKKGKKHKKKGAKKKRKQPKPARPTPAPSAGTVSVNVNAVAGDAFRLQFSATRAGGAPANQATGEFKGILAPGGGQEIGNFAGPVTCLEVEGDEIGLFYPITSSNPPGLEALMAGVFISVKVDGDGQATMAGFLPVPMKEAESCPPSMVPQLLPAEGDGTIAQG